ncbi:MAG: DUF1735 domain-containing protein [Muribaculaceae bacterium]|nr:DUF1735 domain-containing protein [Muribaculaceae bacterium]
MKKSIILSGLLGALVLTTGCEKYDIYPEAFDGVFTIRNAGTRDLVVYATDDVAEVPFVVMKGGYKPEIDSKATLKVMNDEEFAAYQESTGLVTYVPLSPECYSFSPNLDENIDAMDYVFSGKDDRSRSTNLYVRPNVIRQWLSDNSELLGLDTDAPKTPIIPVLLVSETDTVDAYSNVSIIKVNLRVPQLEVDVNEFNSRSINASTLDPTGDNFYSPEMNFSIPCANPWGFTVKVNADRAAVQKYNMVNGTSYLVLPNDAYELQTDYHFEPGVTSMPLNLKIDVNKLQINRNYCFAVTIDKKNPITWDNENYNPGEALGVEAGKTYYFSVRVIDVVILEKIELSTSNVTTNDAEPSEGNLAFLFDGIIGGTSNFFHSGWSVANERESVYASYLEIELPTPMSMFRFMLANRESAAAAGYVKKVHLFGTNDKNNWPTTPFAVIDDMNQQLNGAAVSAEFGDDENPYRADQPYKYLRFCVMESGGGSLGTTSTAVFWHASELELYGF